MVIHQFNKLIRNKWVWGVFAIAISAFFAFDFLVADLDRPSDREVGGGTSTLGGEAIDRQLFAALAEEARGFGRQREQGSEPGEVNRTAWENYAALMVAGKSGLEATDAEVQSRIRNTQAFQQNGAFSFRQYQALLRANDLTPERYEASLRRMMTLERIGQVVLPTAIWSSPMELDQAVADMTDTFTVKFISFKQEKKDADAVKVDEAGLKKWYEDNKSSLEIPERIKIRYVKFAANDPKLLAKMKVSEDAMHDRYDDTIDKYTTKGTNGTDVVKKFEEVKDGIEKDLRLEAAVECLETNLNYRVYADETRPAKGVSRLDQLAKTDNLKIETSDWFAAESGYQDGFMKRVSQILPGAKNLTDVVSELNPEHEDYRYGIVTSPNAVWVIEQAERSAKHVPTFEEAKDVIRPRALRDARAEAFKASVQAIAAKGAGAVSALKGISTNVTFSVRELGGNGMKFENQHAVARAAMHLKKGEVSEFTLTGVGRAILVVCVDRVPGDVASAMVFRSQMRDNLAMMQAGRLPRDWMKWNLARLGFETDVTTAVDVGESEE